MARVFLFGLCWVASMFVQISAEAAVTCLNRGCKNVRIIARELRDIQGALRQYPSSQRVDFHGNLISSFPSSALSDIWSLQALNISYNKLEDDVLRDIRNPHLITVDLTYNELNQVTVPASVTKFLAERNKLSRIIILSKTRLVELILSKNHFDTLRDFTGLNQLKTLDLSCNRIKELNFDSLAGMSSLLSLNLAHNHIYSMYGSGRLNKLQVLDLSSNILTLVGELSKNVPSVTKLYMQHNLIVMADENLGTLSKLTEVDLTDNDWDCGKLKNLLPNYRRFYLKQDTKACQLKESNICCTKSESIFAERLINYHKREFYALKAGSNQLKYGTNCSAIKPSPCVSDDSLVHRLAADSARDIRSKTTDSLTRLKASISQEQNFVKMEEENKNKIENTIQQCKEYLTNLTSFIRDQYHAERLSGSEEPLSQLNELFHAYESSNEQLKKDIKDKQRATVDKLDEINVIETDMENVRYALQVNFEKFVKQNETVNALKKKIEELKKRASTQKASAA